MEPCPHASLTHLSCNRRQMFGLGGGLGALGLYSLLGGDARAAEPAAIKPGADTAAALPAPHFRPRAKNIIFLHMVGGPSQLDLFAPKPALNKHDGQPVPAELIAGQRFAFIRGTPKLLGSKFEFAQHGQAGHAFSSLWKHLPQHADELAIVHTLESELINHAPAQLFMQTGFGRFGRPSFGSWVTYGLGSANQNLPGFVVLISGAVAGAGSALWGSGFLPTVHQGVEFRNAGDPVLFLSNPAGITPGDRRETVDVVNRLNAINLADVGDPEIATRISQYELAYRMQMTVPELTDLAREPQETLELYGAQPGKASFANNCLLARRLVERGVRFVQLYDEGWDHHSNLATSLPKKVEQVDRPFAALLADLKRLGLLDETLVVWTAEFGRTPMSQVDAGDGSKAAAVGRDHHKDAFCAVLAGGGVKPGVRYGETDELGYYPVQDKMHVNDLHATLLHLLGLDHTRLVFKFQGRKFRLTDVAGHVAEKLVV